jgi:hypothetical protein
MPLIKVKSSVTSGKPAIGMPGCFLAMAITSLYIDQCLAVWQVTQFRPSIGYLAQAGKSNLQQLPVAISSTHERTIDFC